MSIQNNLNETMDDYPDIAGYIMEGKNAPNAGGVNAADPEAAAKKMEESYKRLGELVSKQIMAKILIKKDLPKK